MEITRMHRRTTQFTLAALLLAASGLAQQRRQPDIDLQAAIRKETIEGDLNGAIKQYAAIVAKYTSDRAVVAMALVHMADAYRKMGDAESKKIYEQVVKDYADQKPAVALARAGLGGSVNPRRLTNSVVWNGQKAAAEGTISPDGRYLSFVDWDTGDLAIHEFATGEDRYVTHTGNPKIGHWKVYADGSAISHDSKQVAFTWWDDDKARSELRVASLNGEPKPRLLYDDPGNVWVSPRDWSPDGKTIAVLIIRKGASDCIGLVSVADGSLRILRSGTWQAAYDGFRIFFSPDGKYLGYDLPETDVTQPRDLFVFDIAAGREIPVAVRRGQDIIVGWSPDGKRLLFASDRSGALGLWALPFSDGKIQGTPELLKAELGSVEPLGVSRAGTLYYGLASGGRSRTVHVGTIDYTTGKLSEGHDLSQVSPADDLTPYWSPDGKLVAYLSRRGAPGRWVRTIVIRPAEANQAVREIPFSMTSLDGWAPDGQSLLALGNLNGQFGAVRIDVQTGAASPLAVEPVPAPNRPLIYESRWLPDGKTLIVKRQWPNNGDAAFVRRDVESGRETELVRRPFLGVINLSPDGRFIATPTVDPQSNSRSLLLTPLDGSQPLELMKEPSGIDPAGLKTQLDKGNRVSTPMWTVDSKAVLVRRQAAGNQAAHEQWLLFVDGRPPQKLEAPIALDMWLNGVNPDGKRMLYTTGEPATPSVSQIWALENFLPTSR
jgi:Tol biopolymer transport system component